MNFSQAKVSVITPVFNGIQYIEAAIQNIISQQCSYAEHIIVDGGSTDGTVSIIENYAGKYSHIRWISEKDKGQSDAMNKGITMASSKVISFLNTDDFYEKNTLNQVIKIFENLPELSFLIGNCKVWDDAGQLLAHNKTSTMTITSVYSNIVSGKFTNLIKAFPVNPSCYFYHKAIHERVGLYDISDHYTMDFDFIVRLLFEPKINIVYMDKDWGNYRQIAGTKTYEQNLSGNSKRNLLKVLEKYNAKISLQNKIKIALLFYRTHSKSKRKFFNSIIKLFDLPMIGRPIS